MRGMQSNVATIRFGHAVNRESRWHSHQLQQAVGRLLRSQAAGQRSRRHVADGDKPAAISGVRQKAVKASAIRAASSAVVRVSMRSENAAVPAAPAASMRRRRRATCSSWKALSATVATVPAVPRSQLLRDRPQRLLLVAPQHHAAAAHDLVRHTQRRQATCWLAASSATAADAAALRSRAAAGKLGNER